MWDLLSARSGLKKSVTEGTPPTNKDGTPLKGVWFVVLLYAISLSLNVCEGVYTT